MESAFFDLDKTILARSSGLALGRNLYREGLISKRILLRSMVAHIVYLLVGADDNKMEKVRERALELTKGWEKVKIEQMVEEVLGDVIVPTIYKEALDLIEEHQAAGRKVYIVSSSPEEIVLPLARLLEVDGAIGSRGRVDEQGCYTGELDFYCYGEFKAEAIKELAQSEGVDLSNSYAYSDSITDLPMLEAVGNPVAANPDRELRRLAAERDWPIVRFAKPVTLRKRLAELAPPRTTVLTGGVALSLAAAFAGYVWLRKKSAPDRRPPRIPIIRR